MRALRAMHVAFVAALMTAVSARAQTPLAATATSAPAPSVAEGGGVAGRGAVAAPHDRAGTARAAAGNGFVWDNRPSLRFGESFRMDITLIGTGDVRDSSVDLSEYGGAFEGGTNRIGVRGSFLKIFEYQVEHDISSDGGWRDVFLNVSPVEYAQVRAGKFKIPFGYERLRSPADLDFVRRTRATNAIAPGRATGVMVHGRAFKRVLRYQAAIFDGDGDQAPAFRPPPDLLPGETWEQPEGRSWAGRATFAPLRLVSVPGDYNNLEIGGAVMSSEVPEGENHLQGETLIGAKFFSRHYYTHGRRLRTGIEASWPVGPASVSGEYLRSREERLGVGAGNETQLDNDLPELESKGWYIAGTYVLTGEKREGGVKPRRPLFQGGFGAIEVAARYEKLQFSSAGGQSDTPSTSKRAATVDGNGERAATIGVNWYANRWVKVRADFVREQLDDPARGPAPDQSSFWTFVWQFQVAF